MRATTLLTILLGFKQTRVTGFGFSAEGLVVDVKPRTRTPYCASCCRPVRAVYDRRERRWRHLDFAGMQVWLRYGIRRVDCCRCGVTTEAVPWAEHGLWFTTPFEQMTAYLAQRADQTTVCKLVRIAWSTAGAIARRVAERLRKGDPLDGLRRVGVDELSYRRHHEYITVVTDHDRGSVVWASPGRNAETLRAFFDDLGAERSAKLEVVTVDMSEAYIGAVRDRAPGARLVFDRFHVQRLVHNALDEVRRAEVRELAGTAEAKALKKTRWAVQKNPWNLTRIETEKLALLQKSNRRLFRAYLLKESLAAVLDRRQVNVARDKLSDWVGWALRSRLQPFRKAARTIRKYTDGIIGYVATGLSNGRSEGMNGKVRTITRRAYGFHDAWSLIGLIFLCCSGLVLTPPHRTVPLALLAV